jgi:PAS domain S-box-containing protein
MLIRHLRKFWPGSGLTFRVALPAVLTVALFTAAFFFLLLPAQRETALKHKKIMLRELTETALFTVKEFHRMELAGRLSRSEAQAEAKRALREMRYGPEGKDYFWINDMGPKMVMHPYRSDLEGHDISDFEDPNGKKLFVEFVELVEAEGEGYSRYLWQWKDESERIVPKVSYVKEFEPWGWIVGTGLYLDDVEREIAATRKTLRNTSIAIVGFVSLLLASIIVHSKRVDDRKRHLMQALERSEENYRSIFENAPVGIFRTTIDGRYLNVNRQLAGIYGYEGPEKMMGAIRDSRSIFVDPEDRLRMERMLDRGKQVQDFRSFVRRKDGRAILTSRNVRKAWSFDGEECLEGFVVDVTAQDEAEKALKESEQRFRALFDNAFQYIGLLDASGAAIMFNKAALDLLGLSAWEVAGKDFWKLPLWEDDQDSRQVVEESVRRAARGEFVRFETTHWSRSGQVHVDFSIKPLSDEEGRVIKLIVEGRDLTERKQNEQALNEVLNDLQIIFDNSQVGIMYLRDGRVFARGNQRLADILGYDSPEEMAGMSMRDLHVNEEKFREYGEKHYFPLAHGEKHHVEYPLKRKDGGRVWCLLSGKAVDTNVPADLDKGVIWIVDDISERKRIEEELLRAKQLAESASQSKSEFLANMSHEIRTPLNGIMGMLQLMQASELGREAREYAEVALKSCRRLNSLLGDILDLSRIEADRVDLVQKEFDFAEAMQSVAELLRNTAQEKGLGLEIRISEEVPATMVGDGARLQQILFNLVGNAVKFTAEGGVTVEASLLPIAGPRAHRLLIMVSDTGVGIPDHMLQAVFETFTQVDGSYARSYQGAGLGLPIVKRLLRLMGGTMAVASEKGEGTCFYLSLPFQCSCTAEDEDDNEALAEDGPPASLRALVVEDDLVNRMTIKRILEKKGVEVESAEDGEKALEVLRRNSFDIIFMDIQMPVMDGIETTKRIRSMNDKGGVPIIALTACAMAGDREKFLAAGMDDYLSKPVGMDDLERVLSRRPAPAGA